MVRLHKTISVAQYHLCNIEDTLKALQTLADLIEKYDTLEDYEDEDEVSIYTTLGDLLPSDVSVWQPFEHYLTIEDFMGVINYTSKLGETPTETIKWQTYLEENEITLESDNAEGFYSSVNDVIFSLGISRIVEANYPNYVAEKSLEGELEYFDFGSDDCSVIEEILQYVFPTQSFYIQHLEGQGEKDNQIINITKF